MTSTRTRERVLLITRSDDPSAGPVAEALDRRGAIPLRLDTDLFPTDVRLSIQQETGCTRAMLHLPDLDVDLTEATSVWYRRFAPGHALPDGMEMRAAATMESRTSLAGLIEIVPGFHLDEVANVRRAGNKPLQLKWASELGLRVPRSLVTNDGETLRRFAAGCPGGVVAKALSSFVVKSTAGDDLAVYTTLLNDEHLADTSGLRLSPLQFQEHVPKALDLRCTVVGTQVFTAALDANLLNDGRVDWRIEGSQLAHAWRPHALPAGIERALIRLLDRLGLNYGAIDMIVTPDGDYVFLEVNPSGEFLWLDHQGLFPISDAIAGVLVGENRRRV